jgi:hypothetical protein
MAIFVHYSIRAAFMRIGEVDHGRGLGDMTTEIAKALNVEKVRAAQEQRDAIAASAKNVVSENAFAFFLIVIRTDMHR